MLPPCFLQAKDKHDDGKSWLAANTQPAEINVDGSWKSDDWGHVILHQSNDAREITGTSDNCQIQGVASGKKIFLVFYSKGQLAYTAELSPTEDGALTGRYERGILRQDSKYRAMKLRRPAVTQPIAATQQGQGEVNNDPSHVVIYREHYHNCPHLKANVFVDGEVAAEIQNGRYLTLTLPPGKHLIGTSKVGKMGSQTEELDLVPAATYYVHFLFPSAWVCTIEITNIESSVAKGALSKLKPNDANRVKMPAIVSLDLIP